LEDCQRDCEAQRIRDFIKDFIGYIDAVFRGQPLISDMEEIDEN
jgi:hypothetical protein